MSNPIHFELTDIITTTLETCKKRKIADLEPFNLILKERANVYNAYKKAYQEIQQKDQERIQRMETAMALKLAIANQLAKDPNWEFSTTTKKWERK